MRKSQPISAARAKTKQIIGTVPPPAQGRSAPKLATKLPPSKKPEKKEEQKTVKAEGIQDIFTPVKVQVDPELRKRKAANIPDANIVRFDFSIIDQEELKKTNTCKITNPSISSEEGCVLDLSMGPAKIGDPCKTCGGNIQTCPGHFGVIDLQIPIPSPLFAKKSRIPAKLLSMFCLQCWEENYINYLKWTTEVRSSIYQKYNGRKEKRLRVMRDEFGVEREVEEEVILSRIEIQKRTDSELEELSKPENVPVQYRPVIQPLFDVMMISDRYGGNNNAVGSKKFSAIHKLVAKHKCTTHQCTVEYKFDGAWIVRQIGDNTAERLDPDKLYKFFKSIDEDAGKNWADLLGFHGNKFASLFLKAIPVLPNIFRPTIALGEGKNMENTLTNKYSNIVQLNQKLTSEKVTFERMLEDTKVDGIDLIGSNKKTNKIWSWMNIYNQLYVELEELMFGAGGESEEESDFKTTNPVNSLRVSIDGKTGIIRDEALGKRSDYGGRTVVIGDPLIDVDEVGITEEFAERVTKPIAMDTQDLVDEWNAKLPKLQEDGTYTTSEIVRVWRNNIKHEIVAGRPFEIRLGDTVSRKLREQDPIIITRQPVLHKGGMMAFRIRLFPRGTGNVIRINPAVTSPFNADFDGDEMNFSIPQDPEVVNEIMQTMFVTNCIRGDSSAPWIGLIQSAVMGAYLMTQPNEYVSENIYHGCIREFSKVIVKRGNPQGLFRIVEDTKDHMKKLASVGVIPTSGRGLFSFFLPKTLKHARKVKGGEEIFVEDGILYSGVMTSADIGKVPNGMLDVILARYGGEVAITFLSAVQHGLRWFLENRGYSVGTTECFLPNKPNIGLAPRQTINDLISKARETIAELYKGYDPERSAKIDQEAIEKAVRTVLDGLKDRIVKIVKSGGVDIVMIHRVIAESLNDGILLEAIKVAISVSGEPVPEEPVAPQEKVEEEKKEGEQKKKELPPFQKLLKTLSTKRKVERISQGEFLSEMNTLNAIYDIIGNYELLPELPESEESFLSGEQLRQVYREKLKHHINIREKLTGADQFTNSFLQMIYSGAKGNEQNAVAVLGILGQQEVEGRRLTGNLYGNRILPHMETDSYDPVNHGFCPKPLSEGLDPLSFFEYAMAARTNIIETNLRPADTGSFYRNTWTLAEDMITYADGSVRDETGRIVQFKYGGDGLDGRRLIRVGDDAQFVNIQAAVNKLQSIVGVSEIQFKSPESSKVGLTQSKEEVKK